MNRNKRFMLAAAIAGATASTSLPAEAFFGPFNFMRSWGGVPYLGYPAVVAPVPAAPAASSDK